MGKWFPCQNGGLTERETGKEIVMALVVPDAGELVWLEKVRAYMNSAGGVALKLYQNNYTPVQGSVFASFTEATFSGYATAAITDLGAPVTTSNKAVSTSAAAKVFTHSGGGVSNTVYGYYVVDAATFAVVWAERFSAPITMSSAVDSISITPRITLFSEF